MGMEDDAEDSDDGLRSMRNSSGPPPPKSPMTSKVSLFGKES